MVGVRESGVRGTWRAAVYVLGEQEVAVCAVCMPFALTAASCAVAMLGQVALFVGLVALVTSHPDDEEFHISTRMWQCFNDEKVLFNGSCQTLLTQNICNSKELLVFIHVDDEKTMIGCRKCHCCEFSLSFFWSKDRTCHSQAKAPQLCNSKGNQPSCLESNGILNTGFSEAPH